MASIRCGISHEDIKHTDNAVKTIFQNTVKITHKRKNDIKYIQIIQGTYNK
jgi:hypothetical protein